MDIPNKKKFNNSDILAVIHDEDNNILKLHHTGDWEDDGKYQHIVYILQEKATGKFFQVNNYRSGSHYSFYYYGSEDWVSDGTQLLGEVQEVEVKTKKWVQVYA